MLIAVNPSKKHNIESKLFFSFKNVYILSKYKKNCLSNKFFFICIDGFVTDKNDKNLTKKFILKKISSLKNNLELVSFIKTLGGAFGIFIYDIQKAKTYFFKDEDGYRPLFYQKEKNSIIISNNIKDLKKIINLDINYSFLKKYITYRYNYLYGLKNNFFKKIFYLPAASYLTHKKNSLKIIRYTDYDIKLNNKLGFEDAQKKIFEETVRLFNLKKAEFTNKSILALSGGMDSTSGAFFIKKVTKKGIDSFTANYNLKNINIDEASEAKKVAKKFSRTWHKININSDDFLKSWNNIYLNYSNPLPTSSFLGYHIMYEKISKMGYNRIINCGNPDHYYLGNYPAFFYYLSDLFFLKKKNFSEELKYWIKNHSTKQYPKSKKLFTDFYNNNILKKDLYSIKPKIEIMGKKYLKYSKKELYISKFKSNNFLNAYLKMCLWMSERQPGIVIFDEMSSNLNIKNVDPYIGERIKNLTYGLPGNYKINKGTLKFIYREIMKKHLPKSIIKNNNKTGYDLPFLYWLNNDHNIKTSVINLLLEAKQKKFYNFININKIISDLKNNNFTDNMFLWQLVNAIKWEKSNI